MKSKVNKNKANNVKNGDLNIENFGVASGVTDMRTITQYTKELLKKKGISCDLTKKKSLKVGNKTWLFADDKEILQRMKYQLRGDLMI